MNNPEILALFDRFERREVQIPGVRREVLPHLVRFIRPAPGMSFILYSCLNADTADAVIQGQIDHFSSQNLPFEWDAYDHDIPADLLERLAAKGFHIGEQDAVMVLDLRVVPAALLVPPPADIRPILHRAGLKDVQRVLEEVWGREFGWLEERLGSHLEIPDYLQVYAAYADGQPVSTGWVYYSPGSPFAGLWGGSTLQAYRGRGFYTALLAARVQAALQMGRRYLYIVAGPMSRPIVEKNGFQLITHTCDCEWRPA